MHTHHSIYMLERTICGIGCRDINQLVADGMFEGDMPCVEADGTVRVRAARPILQVPLDGTANFCQLATDLVVSARVQVNFEQEIAFGAADEFVVEHRLFAAAHFLRVGVGLVLRFVSREPVRPAFQ